MKLSSKLKQMFGQSRNRSPFLFIFVLFSFIVLLTSCGLEWDDISFEPREDFDPDDFQATRIAEALAPTQTVEAEQATLTAEVFVVILTPTNTPPPPPEVIERFTNLYEDTPTSGWIVKAEGTVIDFVSQPARGDTSIEIQIQETQGTISFETDGDLIPESEFDEIRFDINGDVGGQLITFNLIFEDGSLSTPFVLEPLGTQWEEIRVPLQRFKTEGQDAFIGLMWRDAQGGVAAPYYLDDVSFVTIGE